MPADDEFAYVAVTLAGEVAGRPDADDTGDLVPVSGDEDGPVKALPCRYP
jgi:hypothetical protein